MVALVSDRPARSARKAKGDGHLRRAEILEAAQRIFVEQGYEGATIRRIADEVGVSSTALYMHFKDKSEILVEICALQFQALIDINEALLAQEMDPVERVRRMLEGYFDFAFAHPNVYRLAYVSPPDAERGERLIAMGRHVFESFAEGVRRIQTAGRLRAEHVDTAGKTLWASCHGLVSLVLTRPWFAWGDVRVLQKGVLDAVFAGLTRP